MTEVILKLNKRYAVLMQPGESVEFLDQSAKHSADLQNFGTPTSEGFIFDRAAVIAAMYFNEPSNVWGRPRVGQIMAVRSPVPDPKLLMFAPNHLIYPQDRLNRAYLRVIGEVPSIIRRHFCGGLRHGLVYSNELMVVSPEPEYGWIVSLRERQSLDKLLKSPHFSR